MSYAVNVMYADNGRGLVRDAHVLRRALHALSCRVTLTPRSPRRPPLAVGFAIEHVIDRQRSVRDHARRLVAARRRRARWDLNIFLESVDPNYLQLARTNWFFPNQEWLTDESRALLPRIDEVMVKTRHAEAIFREMTGACTFVGFTSEDRLQHRVARRWDRALHIAGWNPHKGTQRLVDLWRAHPRWPHLTAVTQLQPSPAGTDGLEILSKEVSDARLQTLQNACGIHVAPSEVEGFGHTLNEALSCGAILVTVDAPPMNEIGGGGAGVLVGVESSERMASGTRYAFSESSMADAMARVAALSDADRARQSASARRAYEQGRHDFTARLAARLDHLRRGPTP